MKRIMIEESLYEFAKRGRPRKNAKGPIRKSYGIDTTDAWDDIEDDETIDMDDIDVDTSDMENAEEIAVEDEDAFDNNLFRALSNEIKAPEFSRRTLVFRLKGDLSKIQNGVPMAKIGDNAFLFKLKDGKLKKIFLKDIILENKNISNRARMVFEDYDDTDVKESRRFDPQIDEEIPEHDCSRYINRHGQCMYCGKWVESEDEDFEI